jgi:lipopolysaccharide transport system ATP-binding protein
MSAPSIIVNGVSKRYELGKKSHDTLRDQLGNLFRSGRTGEEFWALKDVSFEVRQGEVFGIIGKNGAGKSTLLKLISRITYPTSGHIELRGKAASLLEVGTGFHPELTGRENIYLNGSILGMSRSAIKARFDEIVAFSGVSKFLDTPVKHYSSGMYVRLAFAVAAHLDPEILIIDEVLAVGDAEFQRKCLGRMQEVSADGRTVVFVSHNLDAVRSLCSHGLVLSGGEKVFEGAIEGAIGAYMQNAALNEGQLQWKPETAPRSERMTLHGITLQPEGKKDRLELGDAFELTFDFEVHEPIEHDLDITLQLSTQEGIVLLNTSTFYTDQDRATMRSGRFQASCKFPPYFLNEGAFVISKLIAFGPSERILFEAQHCFSFEVAFNPRSRYGLGGRNKGLLRPIFDWTIESSKA